MDILAEATAAVVIVIFPPDDAVAVVEYDCIKLLALAYGLALTMGAQQPTKITIINNRLIGFFNLFFSILLPLYKIVNYFVQFFKG